MDGPRRPRRAAAGYDNLPVFEYENDVPAGTLWYHDHALGITRLNVYAGLAGFYIIRDEDDPGTLFGNNEGIGLPKYPYELTYTIQEKYSKRPPNEIFRITVMWAPIRSHIGVEIEIEIGIGIGIEPVIADTDFDCDFDSDFDRVVNPEGNHLGKTMKTATIG